MTTGRLTIYAVAVLLFGVAGLLVYRADLTADDAPHYRTATIERGSIRMAISATGKVMPVQVIEVGSQVSGQIASLEADYNSQVGARQIIARIDPGPFEARLEVARADLTVAKANVSIQRASLAELQADIGGAEAMRVEAEADYARKRELRQRGAASQAVVDTALASKISAEARLDMAHARLLKQQAQLESARAQVQAREATARERALDLEHTMIRSPVDGVVIDRNVDVGQTVAASLQAPVLFTIAEDLRRMQVEISVDEADIGRVHESQRADFTVDAFPGREFAGTVSQIRKQPVEESNVVTYTVVALADNPRLVLLPGMTANVEIVVGERQDILKIPEAALRFSPPNAGEDNGAGPSDDGQQQSGRDRLVAILTAMKRRLDLNDEQMEQVKAILIETGQAVRQLREGGQEEEQVRTATDGLRAQARKRISQVLDERQRPLYRQMLAERDSGQLRRGRIWLQGEDGDPTPVRVTVGISDDTAAELLRGEVGEGATVIVGLTPTAKR